MRLRRTAIALLLTLTGLSPLVVASPVSATQDCSFVSSGQVPIMDMGSQTYQGFPGGLYPGASDTRPAAYTAAGVSIAQNDVLPRDANGQVDAVNGKVALISIGMSNTSLEFTAFQQAVAGYANRNPHLVLVNGAQPGVDATGWDSPTATAWSVLAQRLQAAGISPLQVQAVWLKEQFLGDNLGAFPAGAQNLQSTLADIARIARSKYPNLQLGYVASRIYTYDPTRSAGAYQQGFAVKWLIQQQINGDPSLSYGPGGVAPWLSWGPYMWADGTTPRSDGLTWLCSDFQSDGVHPAATGQQKVSHMLFNQFTTDPTSISWFNK
ncbi:MAG TPA: hypothetical protein VGS97_12675 [Actinocrinis sp.]|uniref:hypothetical protein n=1 Tax=Actinocrinis sp. TaxID=1920516 RepID=UPI002DDCA898|nr:hypothetical protein [Actinocrinis sp.]HEV2344943.1 hypothetical protein [Actinocrinis sp.]